LRCSGAGDAIWKDSSGYTYKTIARKIIVVMAEPGNLRLSASGDSGAHGCVWDKMHIEELMKWIPDEDEHLKPLSSMMGGEMRKLFGTMDFLLHMLHGRVDEGGVAGVQLP